jgi:DNA-binding transcriptional LysR family regulator
MIGNLGNLSFKDLELLADLPRFSSLRALARSKNLEAAFVTRTIQKLELNLNCVLLERTTSGSQMTTEGKRLALVANELLEKSQNLFSSNLKTQSHLITIGTRGFLNFAFSELYTKLFEKNSHKKDFSLRLLDLNPEELKVAEHKRLIQAAIYLGEMDWTSAWHTEYVGNLYWNLFVRDSHPIIKKHNLKIEDFSDLEFIAPSYWMGAEIKDGEDGFPIPIKNRIVKFYCQSAMNGLEIARHTNYVLFAPAILTEHQAKMDKLKILQLPGTENCYQKVHLAVRQDAIPKWFLEKLKQGIKTILS